VNSVNVGIENLGVIPLCTSKWWKDLISIERVVGVNWFSREVGHIIGDGRESSFWKALGRDVRPLWSVFLVFFRYLIKRIVILGRWWKAQSFGGGPSIGSCLCGNWKLWSI